MKLLKADLEQLVDIVIFLIKQAPIAPVRRGGRGDVEPGLGAPGKPGGMDPPQGSEGREWKDYVPPDKERDEASRRELEAKQPWIIRRKPPVQKPQITPEPKPKKKAEEPKPGYHKSGRKKGFGRLWQ